MSLSAPLGRAPGVASPAVMQAATAAYDRAHRVRLVLIATLGGAGVAVAAATASGVAAFLIGRRFGPGRRALDRLRRLQRA